MPIRHSHQDHLGHHPPTMSTFERRTLGHPWLKLAPTPPWQATYNGASLVEVCTETTSNLIHLQLAFPKRRTLGHYWLKFALAQPRFQATYTMASLVEV
ncbi:hypothetical protein CDL15_Pgr008342 [Punica granatum]|uniref:Uncharacterized protein n=1 Tax=Punica granatum TaxID=22663 RepID=A0A218XRT1_PUNGR|nr:hypothetical protein CDL15_Pgr008342 [Punica granatum]